MWEFTTVVQTTTRTEENKQTSNEQARNDSRLERDMFVRSLFQRAISKTIAKAGMRITRHDPKRSKHSQEQSAQSTERAISVFETAMSVVRWSRAAARISTHRVSICQMHSTCRSWPCNWDPLQFRWYYQRICNGSQLLETLRCTSYTVYIQSSV